MSSASAPSTPKPVSTPGASTTNSPRRSSRIASKSPQLNSRASNIHLTLAGGVTGSQSPNSASSRRTPVSGRRARHSNSSSRASVTNDIGGFSLNLDLPSDQSDDDEMLGSNQTTTQPNPSALASRSEILSHFVKQPDGYKCKLCRKVSAIILFIQ